MFNSLRGRSLGAVSVVVLLAVSIFATGGISFAQLPPGGTFTDDNLNVHEGYIEAIAAAGITAGCDASGTLYCPSDFVTRGQMATFLARALDLPASTTNWFPDDDGSTHEANINAIADAAITLGLADGTFNPNGFVRRDQMASFLARGIPGLDVATMDYFTDDDGNIHEGPINQMAENAISLGCNADGTEYCPDDNVKRDQMASFLGRALGLDQIVPPPPPTTTTSSTTTTTGGSTTSTGGTTTTTMAAQTFTVFVNDSLTFAPSSLTISAGDSVSFSKTGTGNHNVAFTSGISESSGDPTTSPFTYLVTFPTPGTYTYICDIHVGVGMTGTITVTG